MGTVMTKFLKGPTPLWWCFNSFFCMPWWYLFVNNFQTNFLFLSVVIDIIALDNGLALTSQQAIDQWEVYQICLKANTYQWKRIN